MRLAQWYSTPDDSTPTELSPSNPPFITPRNQVLQRLQTFRASVPVAAALCKNGCTATESPQKKPGPALFLLAGPAQPVPLNPNQALTQETAHANDSW